MNDVDFAQWVAFILLGGAALLVASFVLTAVFLKWRMRVLWNRLSPEEQKDFKLAQAFGNMADAIRRERGR